MRGKLFHPATQIHETNHRTKQQEMTAAGDSALGCSLLELSCICTSQNYLGGVATTLRQNCDEADIASTFFPIQIYLISSHETTSQSTPLPLDIELTILTEVIELMITTCAEGGYPINTASGVFASYATQGFLPTGALISMERVMSSLMAEASTATEAAAMLTAATMSAAMASLESQATATASATVASTTTITVPVGMEVLIVMGSGTGSGSAGVTSSMSGTASSMGMATTSLSTSVSMGMAARMKWF